MHFFWTLRSDIFKTKSYPTGFSDQFCTIPIGLPSLNFWDATQAGALRSHTLNMVSRKVVFQFSQVAWKGGPWNFYFGCIVLFSSHWPNLMTIRLKLTEKQPKKQKWSLCYFRDSWLENEESYPKIVLGFFHISKGSTSPESFSRIGDIAWITVCMVLTGRHN